MAADALQRRQDLGHDAAPVLQRVPQRLLARVERLEPLLGVRHLGLRGPNARRRVDQLLIELAAVLTDRFDLMLEPGRGLDRRLLLGLDGCEVLGVLFQRFEIGFGLGRRSGRGFRRRRECRGPKRQIGDFAALRCRRLRGRAGQPERQKAERRQQSGGAQDRARYCIGHRIGHQATHWRHPGTNRLMPPWTEAKPRLWS